MGGSLKDTIDDVACREEVSSVPYRMMTDCRCQDIASRVQRLRDTTARPPRHGPYTSIVDGLKAP